MTVHYLKKRSQALLRRNVGLRAYAPALYAPVPVLHEKVDKTHFSMLVSKHDGTTAGTANLNVPLGTLRSRRDTMRPFTDTEVIERVKGLQSFTGFVPDNAVMDVWIRAKPAEVNYDRFVDKVFTYETKNGVPTFVMACTGTTNAGAEGLKHFDKYNREGCAVLKSDEIVYASHGYGLHKGKYPAYVERKGFPYYRDGNKNDFAEEIGPVYTDIIGANCHHAGMHSVYIGGWSVACLVRDSMSQWYKWIDFMAKRPTLSVCILKEW